MKTVIEMADEADEYADAKLGVGEYHPDWHEVRDAHFAELVRAEENEACAQIADKAEPYNAADLIRKRMKK